MTAMRTSRPPYFKLRGNDSDGWHLMMFKYARKKDGSFSEYTDWDKPKQFNSLIDVIACIEEENEKDLAA